jgi:hypothetical protein
LALPFNASYTFTPKILAGRLAWIGEWFILDIFIANCAGVRGGDKKVFIEVMH